MDKKITELKEINDLTGSEYVVVASKSDDENYKVKVSDFIGEAMNVDDSLSETSKNPVQNKVIAQHLNTLEDRLEDIECTGSAMGIQVASVSTITLDADEDANVEIYDLGTDAISNVKKLAFKFFIPRGGKGDKGDQGITGVGGRTVFAFKSSKEKPDRPQGGSWDSVTNVVTYPIGWSPTDDLEPPIWMSNATFNEFNLVIDWSDPIQVTGANGDSGADGTALEYIYKRFEEQPEYVEKPTNDPNIDDYVPRSEGWEDHPQGVTEELTCEYVCIRRKDIGTNKWSDWTDPVLWSKFGANGKDGDGVEYIYQLTATEETKPKKPGKTPASGSSVTDYQEREFVPAEASGEQPWYDNPRGVSEAFQCEWVCIRKWDWKEQLWKDWESPVLWAKYGVNGDPGEDGTGLTILGSYDSYEELDAAWKAGTLKGNNPPVVGDTYLINGECWIFDGDDFYNGGSIKGDPGEKVYFHIKYSDDIINEEFTGNNGEEVGKYIGIRTDYTEEDSMVFSDYVWSQFRGNDGFGYEYIFKISDGSVYTPTNAPDVPTEITDTDKAPSGWTDDPTGVSVNYPYEFCCYRKSNADGKWGSWRGKSGNTGKAWLFAMYAESIEIPGAQGPLIYPAGEYAPGETYEQSLRDDGSALSTPYVYHNGTYWILKVSSSSQEPSSESSDWEEMTKFNSIYTEILLADQAKVGKAYFWGNYMFSEEGSGTLSDFDYTSSNPYASGSAFKPNWCVNLVTGEMWAGCGTTYFAADGTGHIGNWYLLQGEKGIGLHGMSDNGDECISLLPWEGIYIGKFFNGERPSDYMVHFGLDGSGSIADGAIAWDSAGNITNYPKQATASITGYWLDTSRSYARITISISEGYDSISSCRVILYNGNNEALTEHSYSISSGQTVSDNIENPSGEYGRVVLYINGTAVSEADLTTYGAAHGSSSSSSSSNIQFVSQDEYDAILPDSNTLYVIV